MSERRGEASGRQLRHGVKYALQMRLRGKRFLRVGDTIVIHFHIPKSGGTSINEAFFRALPSAHEDIYMMRHSRQPLFSTWPSVLSNESLHLTEGAITYIEHHAYNLHYNRPSMLDIAKQLPAIRKNIMAKNGRLFVFTVLRSPVDALLSLRYYMCATCPKVCCKTVTNSSTHENFQLNYIATSYASFTLPVIPHPVTVENVTSIISTLENNFDHIGSTEHLGDTFVRLQEFLDASSVSVRLKELVENRMRANKNVRPKTDLELSSVEKSQSLDDMLYSYFVNGSYKANNAKLDSRALVMALDSSSATDIYSHDLPKANCAFVLMCFVAMIMIIKVLSCKRTCWRVK